MRVLRRQHDMHELRSNSEVVKRRGDKDDFQDLSLNVKYCLADHVGKKRNDFLIYKGKFLSRIQQIKHMGQRQKLLHNLANWIDEEIDNMPTQRFVDMHSSKNQESQVKINKKKLKDTLL